jgi:predicted dehydrogenase/sugar phosphate isomerase/epimerase
VSLTGLETPGRKTASPRAGGFELSGSTLVYSHEPLAKALRLLHSDGFRKVDIVSIPGPDPHLDLKRPGYASSAELAETIELCGSLGLAVNSVYFFPGSFHRPDPGSAGRALESALDVAAALGARWVGMPTGEPVYPRRFGDASRRAGALLRAWADEAEARSLFLAVEAPHAETLTPGLGQALEYMEAVDDNRIGMILDSSHLWVSGSRDFGKALEQVGTIRIAAVHLRDAVGTSVSVTPGQGEIPFGEILTALGRLGYEVPLTVELEFRYLGLAKRRRQVAVAIDTLRRAAAGGGGEVGPLARSGRLLRRSLDHPVEEVVRHPGLIQTGKAVRGLGRRLVAVPSLSGGAWRRRRYLGGRDGIRRQRRGSVELGCPRDRPIRVGILGAGYAGQMHAFGYERLLGVELVGVCDVHPGRARRLASNLGCAAYESLEDMVERSRPDLVSNCTREWEHQESTLQLIEAGVDVFSEKILATRREHAQAIVEAAKKQGRVVGVNYNYRFLSGIRRLKAALDQGTLGELELLDITVHAFSYHHALDLVSHLGGEIEAVEGTVRTDDESRPFGGTDWALYDRDIPYVPSSGSLSFHLRSGALASLSTSYDLPPEGFLLRVDAHCQAGAASLTGITEFDVAGELSFLGGRPPEEGPFRPHSRGFEHAFFGSIDGFMRAYMAGYEPPTPAAWGLQIIDLERAISRASSSGRRVKL